MTGTKDYQTADREELRRLQEEQELKSLSEALRLAGDQMQGVNLSPRTITGLQFHYYGI